MKTKQTMSMGELKNLLLFGLGESVTLFGTAVYTFAVGLYILKETQSPLYFAVNLIQAVLPIVLIGPFVGVLVDRVSRKRLVVGAELANGLLFVIGFALMFQLGTPLWLLYSLTFLSNTLTLVFDTAIDSSKPDLVTEDRLTLINAVDRIIASLAQVAGPILGGVIFAVLDLKWFLLINGISFIVSGAVESLMTYRVSQRVVRKSEGPKAWVLDIGDGIKYIRHQDQLWGLVKTLMAVTVLLVFSFILPVPYALNSVLELPAQVYGQIQSFTAIGMIIGAVVAVPLSKKISLEAIIQNSLLLWSGACLLMALPFFLKPMSVMGYQLFFSLLLFGLGMIISLIDLPLIESLQRNTESAYLGRVISISISMCKFIQPAALLAVGGLLEVMAVKWLWVMAAAATLLYGLYLKMKTSEVKESIPES